MSLDDKTALITGATGGIGHATATLLARDGADVILCGRNQQRGEAIVDELKRDGRKARFVAADLQRVESIRDLTDQVGDIDILINNAGTFPIAPTVDTDAEAFDAVFATNVRAPFFLTAAIAPRMAAAGGGAIVNITTLAAHLGMPGLAAYSATKAALGSLTRTWAAEFGPSGVRVNSVSPGSTRTEAVTSAFSAEGLEAAGRSTPLGRTADPTEIAEVILFLASPRSSYITGATVAADGGRTAV